MIEIEEKRKIKREFKEFSDFFIEDIISESSKPIEFDINIESTDYYLDNRLRSDYKLIITRLDEIENLITTKVAHKSDIEKSKNEIIREQKVLIEESKDLIRKLLIVHKKKSTPNIFAAISIIGLVISCLFLAFSIFIGDIILTRMHFIISTVGFFLMFLMARLSLKIIYERDNNTND